MLRCHAEHVALGMRDRWADAESSYKDSSRPLTSRRTQRKTRHEVGKHHVHSMRHVELFHNAPRSYDTIQCRSSDRSRCHHRSIDLCKNLEMRHLEFG